MSNEAVAQAYEVEVQTVSNDGSETTDWHRIPRRCKDLAEARGLAMGVVDMYIPVSKTVAVRICKVD